MKHLNARVTKLEEELQKQKEKIILVESVNYTLFCVLPILSVTVVCMFSGTKYFFNRIRLTLYERFSLNPNHDNRVRLYSVISRYNNNFNVMDFLPDFLKS